MADKIVQLIDDQNNNIYPISRGVAANSIDTNAIQDGAVTSDKIESATYSTSEQVVGTWVDGKPLYRKVYIKNLSSGTETWIDDLNEKNPIRLEGYMFNDSTQTCQPLGQWANPTDSSYSSRVFCDTTTFKAQVNTGWSRTAYTKIRAILWYTKTTDQQTRSALGDDIDDDVDDDENQENPQQK